MCDIVLGHGEGKSPLFCWCSAGGVVSCRGKGLKSLDGVDDDKAAERVAIFGYSGCGRVGLVLEFAHP